MNKRTVLTVLLIALAMSCLTSLGLQVAHRGQLIRAFDIVNAGTLGDNDAFVTEFTNSYDWKTDDQRINKIQKFIIPLGPFFHYRNNRVFDRIIEIGTEYGGMEMDDATIREATVRMSRHTLSPL